MRSKRRTALVGNLILTLVSTGIAFLLMEGVARLINLHPFAEIVQSDAALGWRPRPNSEGVLSEEGLAHVRINSSGFRDRDHAAAKPPGSYRIAVVGDSYVFGVGVEPGDRFTDVLEQRLSGCPAFAGKKPEVLNFGVSGFGPGQELILTQQRVLNYQPDLVVQSFFSGNDVGDSYKALNEGFLERPYFLLQNGRLVEEDSFRSLLPPDVSHSSLIHQLRSHSAVLELMVRAWSGFKNRKERAELAVIERNRRAGMPSGANLVMIPPSSDNWREAWRVVDALLDRTASTVVEHGARYLLIEIPSEIQAHPDAHLRSAFAAHMKSQSLDYATRHLAEFAAARQIDFFPLTSALLTAAETRHSPVYGFDGKGFGHWNATGHHTAGEALAVKICTLAGSRGLTAASRLEAQPTSRVIH